MVIKRILKRKLLLLGFLALILTANAQNSNYITNHKAIALVLAHTYGIPAPLILAVATIESSGGNGPAAKVLNNHFGIEGENDFVTQRGFRSRYKQYPNVYASYIDFCEMISRKKFYKKLKNNTNCGAWVKAMAAAHYSEMPEEWEHKILGMIAGIKSQAKKEPLQLLAIN